MLSVLSIPWWAQQQWGWWICHPCVLPGLHHQTGHQAANVTGGGALPGRRGIDHPSLFLPGTISLLQFILFNSQPPEGFGGSEGNDTRDYKSITITEPFTWWKLPSRKQIPKIYNISWFFVSCFLSLSSFMPCFSLDTTAYFASTSISLTTYFSFILDFIFLSSFSLLTYTIHSYLGGKYNMIYLLYTHLPSCSIQIPQENGTVTEDGARFTWFILSWSHHLDHPACFWSSHYVGFGTVGSMQ